MVPEHVFITMRDGVRLAADLYVPEDLGPEDHHGPWPAVLEALPYRKDDITASYRPEYVRLASAGYVVCRVDVRGTGSSEGIATDEYPVQEQQDLVEVIDWLATRPWSNGSVGMYGTSYSGFNSIQVAMERPPALKAIIPIFATDDRFADDVHYVGGAPKWLDLIDYPAYMVASNALPPVPALAGPAWHDQWERRVLETEPWVFAWLEHQRWDDYWQHGSLRPNYETIECPTMIVAGWADGYTNNSFRTLAELRCPKRLLLGPWAHASIEDSHPGPNIDIVAEHLRWWDRWLKGIDNGIDREPEIIVFVRHATKPDPDLVRMRGEWRYETGWPLERGTGLTQELSKAATPALRGEGPDSLDVRPDVGWTAWISCAGVMPWGQPDDQRPDEAYSLVYDWGDLDAPVEIMGHPILEATVTSSTPVAYLSAKVCDVFPDGTSALVTRGLLNLTHRGSRTDPAPMVPGEPTRVSLELEVCAYVFEPGHTIRLDLAGTDWPNAGTPPEPVTLTIDRAGSRLILPVLDGPGPVRERPQLAPPPAADREPGGTEGYEWRIERDVLKRETRAYAGSWAASEAEQEHPAMDARYGGFVSVAHDDPGTARAESTTRFEIRWPEATCATEAIQVITTDKHGYHVRIDLSVAENGEQRWARHWERTIPRDLQ